MVVDQSISPVENARRPTKSHKTRVSYQRRRGRVFLLHGAGPMKETTGWMVDRANESQWKWITFVLSRHDERWGFVSSFGYSPGLPVSDESYVLLDNG